LIRPGRVDLAVELGHATAEQLRGLFLRFFPTAEGVIDPLLADYPAQALSPAQIQQALIAADSPQAAQAALRGLWAPN